MILKHIHNFIRLGRPLFLIGGVVFHALGVSIALFQGVPINLTMIIWGQLTITAIQIMTHYSNDYFDLAADHANKTPTRWSGGSRVLVEGRLLPKIALITSLLAGSIALLAISVLAVIIRASIWTIILLIFALVLAWEYSAPPLRLHSRGSGEVVIGLIVPVLTPLVGYTLQTGQLAMLPLLTVFPLFCFQIGMALIINIPDAAGDHQTDKQTLLVRLGPTRSMNLYVALLLLAYLSLPVLVHLGLPQLVAWSCLLPLPVAVWQGVRILRGAWRNPSCWNSLSFWSITLLIGSALLATTAFLWLALNG